MTIAFDAGSTGSQEYGGTITQNHTVGSGINRVLVVGITMSVNGDRVSGVTFNGVALTRIRADLGATSNYLYQLVNPPTGTFSLVSTFTTSDQNGVCLAASFTGVDQTTPISAGAFVGNQNTGPSNLAIAATGKMAVDIIGSNSTGTVGDFVKATAQTLVGSLNSGGTTPLTYGAMSYASSVTTMGWTWSTYKSWGQTALALNPAAVADTTPPNLSSPTGAAISPTSASASVSTDEGAGTIWCLTDTSATATASAIKAGGTSQAVTTTGVQTFATRSGLTVATVYYNHFVQDDAAGTPNTSTVVNSASFTTPASDTVAPFFLSALVANSAPTILSITMSETLAAFTPAASAFTAVGSVSGAKTASSVASSGANVSATFPSAFVYGEAITVTYTKPGANMLQDSSGNQTATFGPSAVTNNVAAGAAVFAASGVLKNLNGSVLPDGAYSVVIRSKTNLTAAPLAVKTGLAVASGIAPGFSIAGPVAATEYIYEPVNESDNTIRGLARATPT